LTKDEFCITINKFAENPKWVLLYIGAAKISSHPVHSDD